MENTARVRQFLTGTIGAVLLAACATTGIEDRVQAVHAASLVLDAHADIALPSTNPSYLAEGGESKVSPRKLVEGQVGAVIMSVAVGPGPRTSEADANARAEADKKLAAAKILIAENPDTLQLAISADEVRAAQAAGKTAVILSFQNARSLEGRTAPLDMFYGAGVRVFGLTHIGHNDYADSSRPFYDGEAKAYEVTEEHGGLSGLGAAMIARVNALGGVVDISQLSKTGAMQAMALSTSPVIASHSNVRAITNVSRNLSDEEIDMIGQTGGVIHVAAFGAYLVDLSQPETLEQIIAVRRKHGLPDAYAYPYELYWELPDPAAQRAFLVEMRSVIGAGSIEDMVDHIDYIARRIGVDHVGIGNDFNHGSGIEGYSDASDAMNLTRALVARGYSDEDIIKIWGGNFLRVFEQAGRGAG